MLLVELRPCVAIGSIGPIELLDILQKRGMTGLVPYLQQVAIGRGRSAAERGAEDRSALV